MSPHTSHPPCRGASKDTPGTKALQSSPCPQHCPLASGQRTGTARRPPQPHAARRPRQDTVWRTGREPLDAGRGVQSWAGPAPASGWGDRAANADPSPGPRPSVSSLSLTSDGAGAKPGWAALRRGDSSRAPGKTKESQGPGDRHRACLWDGHASPREQPELETEGDAGKLNKREAQRCRRWRGSWGSHSALPTSSGRVENLLRQLTLSYF